MTQTKIAIIYHRADYDGILSEAVCRARLTVEQPTAAIVSFGWDYNDPVPNADWSQYGRIFIVDLSVDALMKREDIRHKIVWIDHHKTAISKWGDVKFAGLQLDGVAACRLCWAYFATTNIKFLEVSNFSSQREDEPLLIYLAGVYDVWLKDNPDFEAGKNLQFGLRAMSPIYLEKFIEDSLAGDTEAEVRDIVATGREIRGYCQRQNDDYSRDYAQTIQWEGLTFCALNIGQRGYSDLLLGGIKPEHDACFAWRWTGKEVLVSLYHIAGHEQHDLSAIAKRHGGGGHKGACGFRLTLNQLSDIISPL